jgi:hypothetical protein
MRPVPPPGVVWEGWLWAVCRDAGTSPSRRSLLPGMATNTRFGQPPGFVFEWALK